VTALVPVLLLLFDATVRSVPPRTPAAERELAACTAVTRADVEIALGRKLGRGEEANANGSSTCDYSGGGGQVTVTMQHLGAAPDLDQEKQALKTEFPDSTLRDITVEGANAFFVDMRGAGTLLYLIRGGHDYVMVAILGFGEPETVSSAALKLARMALRQ
jgi:hypothetical protein